MKKRLIIQKICLAGVLCLGLYACNQTKQEVAPEVVIIGKKADIVTELDQDMADFAQALAKSLKNIAVRDFIKTSAAKKFDGDYDILFGKARDNKIGSQTFQALIEANLAVGKSQRKTGKQLIDRILSQNPLLNIAVPVHLEDWNTSNYTPKVAVLTEDYEDMTTEYIKAYDANGKAYWLDAQNEPNEPVIVVGWNERLKPEAKFVSYSQQMREILPIDDCMLEMQRQAPYYISGNQRYYLIDYRCGGGGGGGGGTGGGGNTGGGDPNPGCYRATDRTEKLNGLHFTTAGLRKYEGWPAGAPEVDMRVFVGDKAHNFEKEKEIKFLNNMEPRKRKDIKDKWWNPNKSLFYWNEDEYGPVFLAHFVEDDQQIKILNREVTIPVPFLFVKVDVKIKIDSRDEEMGYMIVNQCAAPPDYRDGRQSYNLNQYFAFSLTR